MAGGDNAWVLGFILSGAGLIAALIGGVVARDRQMSRQIRDGDDKLHERINRVREDYVRRTDLDGHIQRLENNVDHLRAEVREHRAETTKRLDTLVALLSKKSD